MVVPTASNAQTIVTPNARTCFKGSEFCADSKLHDCIARCDRPSRWETETFVARLGHLGLRTVCLLQVGISAGQIVL